MLEVCLSPLNTVGGLGVCVEGNCENGHGTLTSSNGKDYDV